jgi:hypothetical protein
MVGDEPCNSLAHCDLVGLPQYFIWREATHAYIEKIRKFPLLTHMMRGCWMRPSKPGPKVRGCKSGSQVIVINGAAVFCKPWPYEDVFANFLSCSWPHISDFFPQQSLPHEPHFLSFIALAF